VSLVIAPALGLVGALLQPSLPGSPAAAVHVLAASTGVQVAASLLVVSQIFWVIGSVGAGHAASGRSPVLALLGAGLASLGAFAHTVYGGALELQIAIAQADVAHGSTNAAHTAIAASQGGTLIPFLLLGMVGTIAGNVLLAVAVMRAHVAPIWVPILMLVAVAWDYGISNIGGWAATASPLIVLLGFGALGVWLMRTDIRVWQTAHEASASITDTSDEGRAEVAAS
jgi:hypothetical protein